MRLEHYNYAPRVMEHLEKKKRDGELSPLLINPTPAKIRKECLHIYEERFNKKDDVLIRRKDDGLLRAFFGPGEPGKPFMQIITNFETDKFKPLYNYLKGVTDKTEDKNLDLLAWLIDFQPRPCTFDMEAPSDGGNTGATEPPSVPPPEPVKGNGDNPEKTPDPPGIIKSGTPMPLIPPSDPKRGKMKTAIATLWIAVISLAGAYIFWQGVMPGQNSGKTNTGCMYWTGTHYEEIPCDEASKGGLKLPIDQEKMRSFKKITRWDTITQRSVGNVYYIKMNGAIEYFTTGGNHPVDVTRTLRPLTDYMYSKYLHKQKVSGKDSLTGQL